MGRQTPDNVSTGVRWRQRQARVVGETDRLLRQRSHEDRDDSKHRLPWLSLAARDKGPYATRNGEVNVLGRSSPMSRGDLGPSVLLSAEFQRSRAWVADLNMRAVLPVCDQDGVAKIPMGRGMSLQVGAELVRELHPCAWNPPRRCSARDADLSPFVCTIRRNGD